ncbi:MAG: hypothetical protein EP146_19055 [Oscillibacter sp.]|uniref:hypothetical protein n=1 Tax=Oscillibacter sp. TaxID=1945593 RepID=UPI00132A1400|nr:hypothetical protein [Oscillibacter sp.]MUU13182.1 hypothetical protein [Oscillibacter sp.]
MQADTSSVQFTVKVTFAFDDVEETPRSFSRSELEDMVRRWDFSENEWACQDLLISAFPEAVSHWTAEELSEMDIVELLDKIGDQNPDMAIQMMKLLLDTAERHLQERDVAEQLLGNDLYDLCRNCAVQQKLLMHLKQDDRLARQLFRSAYVGSPQEDLLETCDWLGEPELKEKLLGLLKENPHFKGFD